MLANVLLLLTPLIPGWSQRTTFSILKVVMMLVKLTGRKQRTHCKQIFRPFIHPQPLDGSKGQTFFSEDGHVAYAGDEIYGLNKTYLGKVKFNPDFIDCNFPQGLTHPAQPTHIKILHNSSLICEASEIFRSLPLGERSDIDIVLISILF